MKISKREITAAQTYLERNGFEATTDVNGLLIVQNPVMQCGHGGHLFATRNHRVVIRDFASAIRFVHAHN